MGRWRDGRRHEAGSVAVPFAASIILMLGLAALVIDLGHARVVQREIQKAAEAGALAGARGLGLPATSTSKNWTNGTAQATSTVRLNFADGSQLSDYAATNVQAGYWDIRWNSDTTHELNGHSDPAGYTQGTNGGPPNFVFEIPTVKVTIAKTSSGTGSTAPMTTYFAAILGVNSMTMQSSAVAMLPSPSGIGIGDAFPMAMPQNYVSTYWNTEPPASFRVTDSNGDGNWTSFQVDANSVPTIRDLIDNGNPTNLNIGDDIWIEPGVKTSLYDYSAERIGQTVMIPVVNDDCSTHEWTPIVNFVAFYIEDAQGGTGKYIQGHFVKNHLEDTVRGARGNGFGTTSGPKLVQ